MASSTPAFILADGSKPEELLNKEVTLLIDGDSLAFTAASACQRIVEDEFGFVTYFARRQEGEAIIDNMLHGLEQSFGSSHMRIALTCPKENWRNGIWPAYKANRKDSVRPLLLTILKDYMRARHGAFSWDSLEADDVLGILNTEPQEYPGLRILVGADKDYKTVPGYYHRLKDITASGKPIVTHVTAWEAQRFHLYQTMAGDAVDGYPGCPGLGKTRVPALLDNPVVLRPTAGVITRGVNKGNSTTKWVAEPTRDLWAMVVSHFRKAGQGEEEALTMARLAHILHHGDYDRDTKEITLWMPTAIRQA